MDNTPHSSGPVPGEPNAALVKALRRILRPLVKLLVSNQITYPYLSSLLKSIYVEVAESEFPVPGKKQTDSRVSLLTGVHRKDVKRLRAEDCDTPVVPASVSIGAQLVALWLGNAAYHDAEGAPLPLPLRAQHAGQGTTFDDLVEEVARQDIRPRVVLDELLRLGVVSLEDDSLVRLTTGAFTPSIGQEEKLWFFGKNLQDHICAGAHNLSGAKPAFFDRSVYYDELSRESIDTLTHLCNRIGMEALVTVNKQALELQTRDRRRTGARYRMNFGIFNFNTEYRPRETGNGLGAAAHESDDHDA